MKQNIKCIAFGLIVVLLPLAIFAQVDQQEYRTMQGNLIVTGQVGDTSIMMKTHKLIVLLNYSTAELSVRVRNNNLGENTKDYSLNPQSNSELLFKGKLGIDEINTRKHPPLEFEVVGYMMHEEKETLVSGTGYLEHIHADQYACVLNMNFEVSPDILNIDWPGTEKVRIQIIQTVLKRPSDE